VCVCVCVLVGGASLKDPRILCERIRGSFQKLDFSNFVIFYFLDILAILFNFCIF